MSRFLLVSLNIDAILQESTIHRRRERLNRITDELGLGGVYGATIERIKAQGGMRAELGMAALMWVSHSERPLTVDELCHALAVEIGSAGLDPDNVPSMGTLLTCSQGLLAVDEEASTARLVHSALQKYLSTCPHLFDRAHSIIAETCLTYLNFQWLKDLPTSDLSDPVQTPFLGYSSIYWGAHAKRELSDGAKSLALKLFGDYDHHISVKLLLKHVSNPDHFDDGKDFSSFTGLHCASFFGIVEVVAALVGINGCDVNQIDCMGNTPLTWAAENGHEGVVKILLEQEGINPNGPDEYGRTPLSRAGSGYEGMVEMLLGRNDANPCEPNKYGQAPLYYAAFNGHEGVVKMLLERDEANPDKPGDYGRTPLHCAAINGSGGVVKMLLERDDVNPITPDNDGGTPLHCAASSGSEGVVKMLLERDEVNPNTPDNNGQTPLLWAARDGHKKVVNLLLERRDISADRLNDRGQTPLSWAAKNGHEGVVSLLLRRGDVSPDRPSFDGRAPLSWAAGNGHEGVVKLLLERHDVNPDRLDYGGLAPLSWAVKGGREGVVRLLLERNDVNPDRPDTIFGQTPLSSAV